MMPRTAAIQEFDHAVEQPVGRGENGDAAQDQRSYEPTPVSPIPPGTGSQLPSRPIR